MNNGQKSKNNNLFQENVNKIQIFLNVLKPLKMDVFIYIFAIPKFDLH